MMTVLLALSAGASRAGTDASVSVATIASATPLIRVMLPGSKDYRPVTQGATLPEGATVVTMAQGRAEIRFTDGHFIVLSPNSSIEIKRLPRPGSERTLLRLVKGAVRALVDRSRRGGDFGIYANTTVTAVKGTDYEMVRDEADNVDVEVNEGRVNTAEMKSEDAAIAEAAFMAALMGTIGQLISEGNRCRTPHGGRMSRPERMSRPPREPHRREGANSRSGRREGGNERGGRGGGKERGGRNTVDTPDTSSGDTPSTESGGSRGGRDRANDRGGKGKKGRGGNNQGPGMPSMPGMGGLGF